jgi:Rrf2 family transcriptional regulator, cysteine metabolism repressor
VAIVDFLYMIAHIMAMNVSSKSRYAVDALVELALRSGGRARPVRAADLAAERDLPEHFVEQLFGTLRRGGMLTSRRGAGGGFAFARRPERVTVLDVVEALDGPVTVAACTGGPCEQEDTCGPASVWHDAVKAFEGVLATTTIADLAERERQLRTGEPTYDI